MKLELKHLAPYFPYRLNMCKIDNGKYFIVDLQILNIIRDYDDWKPILRPLSDLTKEIEHNGKTFVPMDNFQFKSTEEAFKGLSEYSFHLIEYLKYKDVLNLIKWHFDVFGLIDAGLAININTIK